MRYRPLLSLAAAVLAVATLAARAPQVATLAIDDVRPGMVGTGRTVFAGNTLDDFKAEILGTLRNVIGPSRNLIIAKLSGGPLASTGVIAGMSGSPVYVDGKLIGAVSYALGSFPKEPIAGITPIAEMTEAVDTLAPRTTDAALELPLGATPAQVFAVLRRVTDRAGATLGSARDISTSGPSALLDLASGLRPIGAAMLLGGLDPSIAGDVRNALGGGTEVRLDRQNGRPVTPSTPLRPGDPVGVSLMRGDLEAGATGTVTAVTGNRVYAFGHPFLNLGPITMSMTRAQVLGVLPSLDSSLKIATLGEVIGTMNQDRATAIGGTLGPGPRELAVNISLSSARGPQRKFSFFVLQDPTLTPLFSYVGVLNVLAAYERQAGMLSIQANGTVSFGADGVVTIDDFFSGDGALTAAAGAVTAPVSVIAANEIRPVLPQSIDLQLKTSEMQETTTIERVWLDTTRPTAGATHHLQVLLRNYRGTTETITIPVTMPAHATGPLTLLVSDAATLSGLEQRELKPARPRTIEATIAQLNLARHNNRIYVRLLGSSSGSVVGGETLSALPPSAQSILDADKSVSAIALTRSVVGAWERRVDRAVRGSRELTITLAAVR